MPSVHWQQPWVAVNAINRRSATPDADAKGHIKTQSLWQYAAMLGLAAEKQGYEQVPAFAGAQEKIREAFKSRHLSSGWTEEELAAEIQRGKESLRQNITIPDFDREEYERPDRLTQAAATFGGFLALAFIVGAGWLALTVLGWLFGFGSSGDFLETVRAESSSFDDIPDSTLLETGESICDADDAGMEDWAIRANFITNGMDPSEIGALAYAAREHLC